MNDVFLVSCCRTAIGKFGGTLKGVLAPAIGTAAAKAAIERSGLAPENIDEVFFGCVLTAGLSQNVARQVSIGAGVPQEVTAYKINMICGSGMKTVIEAARAIICRDIDIALTGGAESMSDAPYVVPSARFGARMGNFIALDTMIYDGLTDAFNNYHMGITAENVCDQWGITREELDAFALSSQTKAAAAIASGRFNDEIAPITVKLKKEAVQFKVDEFPRETTMESLMQLPPAFKPDGRVTAGNSSGVNDGGAAIILASGDAVKKYGLKPLARLVSWGHGGVDPKIMGIGPVPATKQALKKAGLTIDDIDLIESNEAFASQSIAVARELGFDMAKVNVNGGAIALGHPIGATGARIIVTLIHEMLKRDSKRGLATLCMGGGMGLATIWERV